jgi:hypothetical protein
MRDITALMNTYRECSRNLWNVYFAGQENVGHSLDTYEPIRKMLFDSLVVDELSYEGIAEGPDVPPPALRVVPKHWAQVLVKALSAPGEASYWGHEMDLSASSDDVVLAFIDYFDFSNVSLRDFQYYRCKVLHFSIHPEYEGREALIQALDGRVFHDEEHDDAPSHLASDPAPSS